MSKSQREAFAAEAERRGLGVSTTIRSLAVERAKQLAAERQRERARRWQTERVRRLADRIESGGFVEASQAQIDAIFDGASNAGARSRRKVRAAAKK